MSKVKKMITKYWSNWFSEPNTDADKNIQFDNGGICLKKKNYPHQKSLTQVEHEIQNLAEMPLEEIVWIFKDEHNKYNIDTFPLEVVLNDLKHNGYSATPF